MAILDDRQWDKTTKYVKSFSLNSKKNNAYYKIFDVHEWISKLILPKHFETRSHTLQNVIPIPVHDSSSSKKKYDNHPMCI